MGKKKVFVRTDLTVHSLNLQGRQEVDSSARLIPNETMVRFPAKGNGSGNRSFDFAPWYGVGIDEIVSACQKQIERFLLTHDGDVSPASVVTYCVNGLNTFFDFLLLHRPLQNQLLSLGDIDRRLIDGYLSFLSDGDISQVTQSTRYHAVKAVLTAMAKRGAFHLTKTGDSATFPRNAFPNSHRSRKGEEPITKGQRQDFTAAVKTAVKPIFKDGAEPTSELLSYALLIVSLHTGRNTVPLLELTPDCLIPHPKANSEFLVVHKRRSRQSSKVILGGRQIDSTPHVFSSVAGLIRRVIELTHPVRADAPEHLRGRLWVYRSQSNRRQGEVWALSQEMVAFSIKRLVADFDLKEDDGKPLRINISRLRKTFINRINEILGLDLITTAAAAGNSPRVTGNVYLRPDEDTQKRWRFMGIAMTKELLTSTIGMTEKTPAGACSDVKNGQYAPRRDGATCMNFLDCVRCRNYVVTGEDLHRLFSLYWRVFQERGRIEKKRWKRHYGHIARLIEKDVIQAGLASNAFTAIEVARARENARIAPHPFWSSLDTFGGIA
jgi:hypothetical protein